jgi:ubiquitin-conjugating enzyme E2 D/E
MALQLIRLNKEWEMIKKDPISNVSTGPIDEKDLTKWFATILGPEDTPYAGGVFNLIIEFPSDYPYKPPKLLFQTPIFHPNISPKGAICLDILKTEWSPALNISRVLLSLCSLLSDPNPNDPLVLDVADLYKNNKSEFIRVAREWTIKYAG